MIDLSPATALVAMFATALGLLILGFPLAFVLGWTALAIGFIGMGPGVAGILYSRIWGILTSYVLIAGPLFVFMGLLLEAAGITERLYNAMYVLMGRVRGGLAIGTILIGIVLAVCVGVIAASVITMGIIALPSMLGRGYSKDLACGSVCAGGTLGILIPPSVMLVFYGPTAGLSVGKLFMGAFIPGLILALLYIVYLVIRCLIRPKDAPSRSGTEVVSLRRKGYLLFTALTPPAFIVLAVLGTIFFGIASPTEAAALGVLGALILAFIHRKLKWETLKEASRSTGRLIAMAFFIAIGAGMFAGVFISLGSGDVLTNSILAVPGGKWGSFATIMLIAFILGMFIDWLGILFVMVPLVTPIAAALGFDPIWFALMMCINLQMSFMTPPFAYAIYYVKGLTRPEWGIETKDIIKGVIPYVFLIMVGLALCAKFPQLILWLPSIAIG